MEQLLGQTRAAAGHIDWRPFLRGFAEELDSLAGTDGRDDMLRGIGRRMSRMMPLPPVYDLGTLEIEMNDALGALGWGEVRLVLLEGERLLQIVHSGLPRIGSLGTPPGQWLSPLLEGMYDGWLAQQPGHSPVLSARRQNGGRLDLVVMNYGRQA